jgi:hypothetical protein
MIKDREEWLASIRDASLLPEPPVHQKDGRWKVADRLSQWKALGPKIFDDYLDRFQKVATEVFRERDPQFDLQPDQRFAANLYGKVLKHSNSIRSGMAETLALLGSYPEYLTSCSQGKAEYTARVTVLEILKDADWSLWASLNDVLPLLAEAAPKEFLDAVEHGLNREPCPFDGVFEQEGSGITGRIYTTGLLWALETLAWDATYLTRVVMILGELAARDPGGNWANRPANSLWTILLPWFPQTCAPVGKRLSTVTTLQTELPDVAWKLLLNLLPRSQQSSSMTHKPAWRKIIPDDWSEGATGPDYWEQVTGYAELAIGAAKLDRDKLVTLVSRMNNLPPDAREQVLSHLSSDAITSLPQDERLPIWNELTDMVSTHKKFADAKWAMPSDEINRIASIAERLEPDSPAYKHRRLFTERDLDLYEEREKFTEQSQKLEERRRLAADAVHSDGGTGAVIEFAETVELPWKVGFAFGEIASSEDEKEILPHLLESEVKAIAQFANGFVLGRFQTKSWQWVDHLDMSQWTIGQKAALLAYLPFNMETWQRATLLLGHDEGLYWKKTPANPYQTRNDLEWAIDRLVENNRINAAIDALEKLFYSQEPIDPNQVVRVLNALGQSADAVRGMDTHAVTQLIRVLQQNPDTNQEELFKIEWAFLGLLDGISGPSPTLLEKTLAANPDFFCEVIQIIFRSDKEDKKSEKSTENQEGLATNAYRLLRAWKTPPGTQGDGTFDGGVLNAWLERVKARCTESGHLKVAMEQVGEVLFYSPPDPQGLWLHKASASILNAKDAEDLRRGYEIAIFSSRGVHFVDPQGRPERELANIYRKQAEEVELAGYHRLAVTLREVAESYDREAEQNTSWVRLDE